MDEMNKRIPIIIPSLEPNEALIELLEALKEVNLENVIIVNDGSSEEYDSYFKRAEKMGCIILTHEQNYGKGRALKTAFSYCLTEIPDLIGAVTADSDGQHSVKNIVECMKELFLNENSLVLGTRTFDGAGVPWKSKFGNKITRLVCKFLCDLDVSDTQTGLRGIPKGFMQELINVKSDRFEFETQMLIDANKRWEIRQVPIETIYDSAENHSTHFRAVVDSIRIYRLFAKIFVKYIFSSVSSFVLDIALFAMFEKILLKNTGIIFYAALSTVLARVISAMYNYIINYVFVFKSEASIRSSASRYFLLAIIQMSCSAIFVTGMTIGLNIPDVPAKIVVDTVLFFVSYYIQNTIVYKRE